MTNAEQRTRTERLALDLGLKITGRRPYAKELFKLFDIDLLPHSDTSTLLGELFSWSGRAYRANNKNLAGYLYRDAELTKKVNALRNVPRHDAMMPDFEFTKEHVLELNGDIPSLFKIAFTGKLKTTKELSVVVKDVTKARLTNIDEPGISLRTDLSEFAQRNTKAYRKNIKNEYMAEALFYAKSVEVTLEKGADLDVDVSFDPGAEVEVGVDTSTKKKFVLKYTGAGCPFAATMRKGRAFAEQP